jgi:hypothetical protein
LLDHLFDELAFVDGQRERLLAVDVFSGEHGLDGDLGVPVVGHGDHDRVDIFAVEDFAVVAVGIRLFALAFLRLFDVVAEDSFIDVGQGGEIGKLKRLAGDLPALISQADSGKDRTVICCLVAERPVARPNQNARGARGGDALQKLTTRGLVGGWHLLKAWWKNS